MGEVNSDSEFVVTTTEIELTLLIISSTHAGEKQKKM